MVPDRIRISWARLQFLNRAIDQLTRDIDSWVNGNSYKILEQFDLETREKSWHLRLFAEPALEYGFRAGDCIHNLRALLDNLIWLSAQRHHDPPPFHTQFPICLDERSFKDRKRRMLSGLPDHLIDAVRKLQPYIEFDERERQRHPLWVLERLDAIDKHRGTTLTCMALRRQGIFFPMHEEGTTIEPVFFNTGPLHDSDEIMRVRVMGEPDNVNAVFALAIGFAGSGLRLPGESLPNLEAIPVLQMLAVLRQHIYTRVLPVLGFRWI